MEVALTPSLRDVRLAALLVHALPDRVLALDDAGGGRVLVGFRRRADLSPCALRETVASVLADGDLPALGPALGLRRGPLRARILEDELDDPHIGLGVYRYDRGTEWGYAFATTLSPEHVERLVRDAVCRLRLEEGVEPAALELGCMKLVHDPQLDVTAAFSEYSAHDVDALDGPAGRIAIHFATACLADELILDAR